MNVNVKSRARDPYSTPVACKLFNLLINPLFFIQDNTLKNNELVWADSAASMHRVHCTRRMMHSCLQEGQWLTRAVCTLHNQCLYYDCKRCLMSETTPYLY